MTVTFDPVRYQDTTRAQWEDAAAAWHAWGPTLEDWRAPAWSDRPFPTRLAAESVTAPSAVTERMGEAARAAQAWLAVGVNERDRGGGMRYDTLLYVAPDGSLRSRHRRLVPTGGERTRRPHTEPFPDTGGVTNCAPRTIPLVSAGYGAVSTVTWCHRGRLSRRASGGTVLGTRTWYVVMMATGTT